MLPDIMFDENGELDKNVLTDIVGNEKQTIINRLKTLIIKKMIYENLIRNMCGDRIIDERKKEIELECKILETLRLSYYSDSEVLNNLAVSVLILNSVIWIFFYYNYNDEEQLFIFDKKIKL